MKFQSINPYNGKVVGDYTALTEVETLVKLDLSKTAFQLWKDEPLDNRIQFLRNAADILRKNSDRYAEMITLEMGKPIIESKGEVNKCAWVCDYYAENASDFLQNEVIKTDADQSFVRHDPIGAVFAIMPWNFPFWQVFRYAAPTLTAGNTGLLKHAPNVFGCAEMIQEIFDEAGYPEGVFQNLIVHHDLTETIVSHDIVQAVTLTGSEKAGSAVASIAGKHLRRSLLELGGNNAFIVWEDADIDQAVKTAITARMLNCGQSCIAAKRFILVDSVYDEFVEKYTASLSQLKAGDPLDTNTQVGPLARIDLTDQLHSQVERSIAQGAKLLFGGNQRDCYHEPTILGDVTPNMVAFTEETFGPLSTMVRARDIDHAFELAELSSFGLGSSVFTKDITKAVSMADRVSDGAYFINELVKSDPRLPFGGTKNSGYGRELGKDGMMEFVNRKTVYVKS